MGTRTAVEIYALDQQQADQCSQRVFAEMRRIDALMSPYIQTSELAIVNQQAAIHPVKVSQEMFDLLKLSMRFSEISSGAFDITYASVGYLYDYRNKQHPTEQQIKQKLQGIDYKSVVLDESKHSVFFSRPDTRIDLGGIAKGYAVDNAVQILKGCGIQNALVTAGGDSRILGDKAGRPWIMGVRHPRDKDKVVVSIPLTNTAISTSGDYERYFIEGGKRFHHIIKPSTGKAADKEWSVSVITDKAVRSDALSTSLFVMGTQKALDLVNSLDDVEAIIINAQGKMFYSNGLMPPTAHY